MSNEARRTLAFVKSGTVWLGSLMTAVMAVEFIPTAIIATAAAGGLVALIAILGWALYLSA